MDLLLIIMDSISPGLKKYILDFVSKLPNHVKNSTNPLDKLFVGFLLSMFNIKD